MKILPAALIGLLLAAPAVAQVPDWTRGTPLTITLTNRGIVPARIVMKSGAQYILHFRNASDRSHNFSAQKFFDYARVNPRDQAWVSHDDVNLKAGERATVAIVAPTTPGAKYAFRSTRVEDAGANMKGAIFVR